MDTINISGITYYKLNSVYSGDTKKECGLVGSDIDKNFFVLRGHDIEYASISGNNLVFKRLNGSEFSVDLLPEITVDDLHFTYDKENGIINVEYSDGSIDVISGFTVNPLSEIYTDNTLNGKGTINDPLGISSAEKTGSYAPAKEYRELNPGEELSLSGNTFGDRIVTKEIIDVFGRLYSKEGAEIISENLSNSNWRIPSKNDWDLLLDSLEDEHTEEEYIPHSAETIGLLGEDAAQPLKSDLFWEFNDNPITEDGTCGFDVVGFNILPVGEDYDGDKSSEGFGMKSGMWTSTSAGTQDEKYIKEFFYDTNKVGQKKVKKGFFSIRLVKDFDGCNYKNVETIFGQSYPTTLTPETNQIWTSINVYATKKQLLDLSKNTNFIEINKDGVDYENAPPTFYINEWNGCEWIKKELKEGDSIVITQRDIDSGITKYYRRWVVQNGELNSFEDYVDDTFSHMQSSFTETIEATKINFNNQINVLQETINDTIESTINNFNTQINELTNDFNNKINSLTDNLNDRIDTLTEDFSIILSNMENSFNSTIQSLSGDLSTQLNSIDSRLESFINDELEGTIKYTIRQYIEDTTNEIKITETDDGKLKIGFSDNAIFG